MSDLCEVSVHMPRPAEIKAHYDAWCRSHPVAERAPVASLLPAGGVSRLPATPDQAWTREGAIWAVFGTLPDGWDEARLAEAEAEARDAWMASGTTSPERVSAVVTGLADLLVRGKRPAPVVSVAVSAASGSVALLEGIK